MSAWKKFTVALLLCLTASLLTGCLIRTTDQMYSLPRRSQEYEDLQKAVDSVMSGLKFSAPTFGENQQTLQMADLDGDGREEAILFAKSAGETDPLRIFVFHWAEAGYEVLAELRGSGSAFEQAEYAQIDGEPGLELIVGRQLGEGVPHSLAVYSFRSGKAERLLSTGYARFLTMDLTSSGSRELFVLSQDEETGKGLAELYFWGDDGMERSAEAMMSVSADKVRRIITGNMCAGTPAVFVASVYDENSIITDVYAMVDGRLTNVSLSSESGTSVETIRNYYVYAGDMDGDGLIELPQLLPQEGGEADTGEAKGLIRWYNLLRSGEERDKLTTYHNYAGGWYVVLPEAWRDQISVLPGGDGAGASSYVFGLWNSEGNMERLFTIYAFSGEDRETRAGESSNFELGRKDDVIYCAALGTGTEAGTLTQEDVTALFHFIQIAWKTGET